jgi:predicted nucleotidyltransferase
MVQVDDKLMTEIVRCIVAAAHPYKVVLFGSRGRGDARAESDIDLLVVSNDARPRTRRAAALYGALSDIIVPMDVVIYRPKEIREWQNVPQAFVTVALREGKVLYAE